MRIRLLAAAAIMLASLPLFAQNEKTDAQAAAAAAAQAFADKPVETPPAPKPVYWKKTATSKVNFNQQKLKNWAAGGINNVSLASNLVANANYAKNHVYWNNALQLDYGFIYQEDKPFIQKNVDRLYLNSIYGYRKGPKFGFSSNLTLISQLTNTYNYIVPKEYSGDSPTAKDWRNCRTVRSGFFSPAYFTVGVGMDWVPNPTNKWLVVNFTPLTGSFTMVGNEELRTSYGMKRLKEYEDEAAFPYQETTSDGTVIKHGEYYRMSRFEFGAQLNSTVTFKINNKFNFSTNVILFSNYLYKPLNMRVDVTNRVNWAIAKYISLSFTSFIKYDDNVLIKNADDLDIYPNGKRRVQLQELLGLGFSYTFPGPKK